MKKFLIVIFLLLIININNVYAQDISIDNVIDYMNANNILNDSEYFYLFGDILNPNADTKITNLSYVAKKENNSIYISLNLNDELSGLITKNIVLNVTDNIISYTNDYALNSLESRLITFIFNEIIYSIGGARGYDKDVLINWMNQIDLNNTTLTNGLEFSYENITQTANKENTTFNYEISIPKFFKIDINKLPDELPDNIEVIIKPLKSDFNALTFQVLAKTNPDKMCIIYRENDHNEYEKIGQVSCNNGEFTDNNLKENTTYNYEVTIDDVIMCASSISLTTTDIPKTGTNTLINIGGIILLIGLFVILIIYHRNKIYKI